MTIIIYLAFVTFGWFKKLILGWTLELKSFEVNPSILLCPCILMSHHYLREAYWCEMCRHINISAQHFRTWLLLSVLILEVHERPSLHVEKEIRTVHWEEASVTWSVLAQDIRISLPAAGTRLCSWPLTFLLKRPSSFHISKSGKVGEGN